jgi:glycosyltransferase involved in cell wall biosynthesis
VKFLGFIEPIERLSELVCAGDLMIVHIRSSTSGAVSLPSRMLSYMACARPVLVASQGAPRRLIEKASCGATCEPEDPRKMADTIVELYRQPSRLEEMGRRGRETYLAEFSERVVLDRLIKLIERVGNHRNTK